MSGEAEFRHSGSRDGVSLARYPDSASSYYRDPASWTTGSQASHHSSHHSSGHHRPGVTDYYGDRRYTNHLRILATGGPPGHRHAPSLGQWGRSNSVPERYYSPYDPAVGDGDDVISTDERNFGLPASSAYGSTSTSSLRPRLRPRLGRQLSVSSDYVASAPDDYPDYRSYAYPPYSHYGQDVGRTPGHYLHDTRTQAVDRTGHYQDRDITSLRHYLSNNSTAAEDARHFTERRKKTVRFDSDDFNESGSDSLCGDGWMTIEDVRSGRWARWDTLRQESQDSTTRDSGIETSSCFTSSEDSNRGETYQKKVKYGRRKIQQQQ